MFPLDCLRARASCASASAAARALDAYERLIHDVMLGDRTVFASSDAIERLWEISEPLLAAPPPTERYAADSAAHRAPTS